jgi:signal transduction histidine kinase
MENYDNRIRLSSAALLRKRAEEQLGNKAPELNLPLDQETARQIVHELEVHQIELVMQNEELREARYEVEAALEKYTDLYELAPAGYFSLDRTGNINAANLAAANLLQIERSLIIGRSFEHFIVEKYRPTFAAFLAMAFNSRSEEACKVVIINNVGARINVQIGASLSSSGTECHIALIDLSGQKKAESVVIEIATSDSLPTVADKLELELCVFSLREAVETSLTMFKDKALEENVTLQMDIAAEADERIVADEGKLKQILFSLLANAIRFTPADGTVNVSAVRDGDFIKITVTDTGIGIRTEELPNLFQAFTQQDSVYSAAYKGSGLCLAMTRQVVELHGGTIWAESEFGAGSRFSFTIPFRNCMGIT